MSLTNYTGRTILWWGRFDRNYSRNRILISLLRRNGFILRDFVPLSSYFGALQALVADPGPADLIWVPCFRHRDFISAKRYGNKHQIPVVFDPLISAWDKAVFERRKFSPGSHRSKRLLHWEQSLFGRADAVVADTHPHAEFYQTSLTSDPNKTFVIPVGAEQSLFLQQPDHPCGRPPEILFFGSFIDLQGPEVIVAAARLVPAARWTMLGDGPLRSVCETGGSGCDNLFFEDWLPYEQLPQRIGRADIILGIFGGSAKASRVIPNKVYQALACGRPVVTRQSDAYPAILSENEDEGGLFLTPPADPAALAEKIQTLLRQPDRFHAWGQSARLLFDQHFSETAIETALAELFAALEI